MAETNGKRKEPFYRRIASQLEVEIVQGDRAIGSKLPTEDELCQQWQVSSITVRRSLLELVRKGLIEKRQGEGSFVINDNPKHERRNEKLLGFVVPNSGGYQNGTLLEVAETAVRQLGYSLVVKHSQNDPEQEADCVDMLLEQSVSGIIIVPVAGSGERTLVACSKLIAEKMPFVLLDRYLPVLNSNYVTSNNEQGGYEATKHLIKLGHKRIAHIHTASESSVDSRMKGYRRALKEAGIQFDADLLVRSGYDDDNYRIAARKLFEQTGGDFTALFAVNDDIARNAYLEIRERGLSIPEDIAVVGHDDATYAEFLHPPLTTIRQSAEEMSLAAVDLLMDSIQGLNHGGFKQVIIGQDLIIRGSSIGSGLGEKGKKNKQSALQQKIINIPASSRQQSKAGEDALDKTA